MPAERHVEGVVWMILDATAFRQCTSAAPKMPLIRYSKRRKAIARLLSDPQSLAAMGARARAMLDANFTRRQAFERWRDVLDRVEQGVPTPAPDEIQTPATH